MSSLATAAVQMLLSLPTSLMAAAIAAGEISSVRIGMIHSSTGALLRDLGSRVTCTHANSLSGLRLHQPSIARVSILQQLADKKRKAPSAQAHSFTTN
jgi:hypothetical protein